MANYIAATRTNYFKVTDEEKLCALLDKCTTDEDDSVVLCPKIENDGSKTFSFYCEGALMGIAIGDEDSPEYDFEEFIRELQSILPDDEAVIITEVGREKMRYLVGEARIITKNDFSFLSLDVLSRNAACDMLKNSNWTTQNNY
jgi:hypothetical protein